MEFLEALHHYFRGEKLESIAILTGSALLLVAAAILITGVQQPFARGLGGVLLVTALIGAVVGGTIVFRTERQVAQLVSLYEADRSQFAAVEGSRMETVVRSFQIYKGAYVVAVLGAVLLLALGSSPMFHGVGVGLLLFAALGFTVDHYAEARAIGYAEQVRAQDR
jgi:uncharacterized membrane-anchored protein